MCTQTDTSQKRKKTSYAAIAATRSTFVGVTVAHVDC
jgi:hypothetical protein